MDKWLRVLSVISPDKEKDHTGGARKFYQKPTKNIPTLMMKGSDEKLSGIQVLKK